MHMFGPKHMGQFPLFSSAARNSALRLLTQYLKSPFILSRFEMKNLNI